MAVRVAPVIVALVAFAVVVALVAACGSSAPPKAAEPEPAPLVIPPLPPQKDPEPRPVPREAVTVGGQVADPDGPLTTPGPLALPCNTDAECMTHRCNMRFAKCTFPCKTDRDCIAGATCYTQGGAMATCVPKPVP